MPGCLVPEVASGGRAALPPRSQLVSAAARAPWQLVNGADLWAIEQETASLKSKV